MANNKEQIGFIKAASEVVQHEAKKVSATSIELAKYEAVSSAEKYDKKGWMNYGVDNLYPQYLIDLYYGANIHGALCNGITKMIAGDGIYGNTNSDLKLKKWKTREQIHTICSDFYLQGGFYLEVILSVDKKTIVEVNHLPFENCRLSVNDDSLEINGIFYSRDWAKMRETKNKPTFIPLLPKKSGLITEDMPSRYVVIKQLQSVGSAYYPKPPYISALHAIELERQISVYHVNNIMNGLFPSFIIQMNNGQPDEEKAIAVRRDIEKNISGASNAGKFIVLFNDTKETAAQFDPFPISDADKQYQTLFEQARENIFVGHSVTSPLLFGVRDTGGGLGSNTDELTTAREIFMKDIVQPYRNAIIDVYIELLNYGEVSLHQISFDKISDGSVTVPDTAADKSYNGAQIASAVSIMANVKEGVLTEEQAIAFLVQFLNLPLETAQAFFPNAKPIPTPAPTTLSKEHVCCKADNTLSEEDEAGLIARLETLAETIDAEEWEEIDIDIESEACATSEEEAELLKKIRERYNREMEKYTELSLASYANGDERSEWGDVGLFKLRFIYSENISADSREFCKAMVRIAKEGKVFRFEDIAAMSDAGENGQFAPQGQSTYDIFTYKGGAFCHHRWLRKIYFRKREKGRFLPNHGLKNDILVGNNPFVKPKGAEGIAPINTPTRGSLKYA